MKTDKDEAHGFPVWVNESLVALANLKKLEAITGT